jgi:chromodomain-helicase-DNA-binding protein 4
VVAHWRCLAAAQREEILKSARGLEMVASSSVPRPDAGSTPNVEQPTTDSRKSGSIVKRVTLGSYETTEFICNACMKGGICMSCMEVALQPDPSMLSKDAPKPPVIQQHAPDVQSTSISKSVGMDTTDGREKTSTDAAEKLSRERLYRCFSCKRLAHYRCLPHPPSMPDRVDLPTIAEWYQSTAKWFCPDCSSYTYGLDKIIAWRPYPPNAVEPARPADEPPNYKSLLPREYLVKWADRSFRRTQWVPHMWLVSTQPAKLRNFSTGGSKVGLLAEPAVMDEAKDVEGQATLNFDGEDDDSSDSVAKADATTPVLPSDPIPDAELRIPLPWKTVDRVLDILLWCPKKRRAPISNKKNRRPQKKKGKPRKTIQSDEESTDDDMDDQTKEERAAAFANGEQPPEDVTETLGEFETRTGARLDIGQIHRVVWAFIKWSDLGYEEGKNSSIILLSLRPDGLSLAAWDAPPRPGEYGYAAFEKAFQRFINSRTVKVPRLSVADIKAMENRPKDGFRKDHLLKDDEQPELGQNSQLKLMPFQVTASIASLAWSL